MATAEPSPQGISVSSPRLSGPRSPYGRLDRPSPAFLVAVGLAGLMAAATTVAVGVTNDELDHVGIRVFLIDWITLSYIVAGVIAWWRRPDSRFGLLMVAAGFINFLATLGVSQNGLVSPAGVPDWASADVLFTIWFALGALPPLVFLHVFLAYPSGRLVGRLDRAVVVAVYVTWIGLGLVRMLL